MTTIGKDFLYNILTSIALSSFCSATSDPPGILVKYSSPICTSTGGNTTLECDGSYAVYDIFIGRDSEGACGWTESSQLGCSVNFTYSEEVVEMMNIVYNRVRVCGAGKFYIVSRHIFIQVLLHCCSLSELFIFTSFIGLYQLSNGGLEK